MPRGRTLIRSQSRQEQMRRRLLMLGIPLLAMGSSLIWLFNQPSENMSQAGNVVNVSTTSPSQADPSLTPLALRTDSPPPIPEEPNATVLTSEQNQPPLPLTAQTSQPSTLEQQSDTSLSTSATVSNTNTASLRDVATIPSDSGTALNIPSIPTSTANTVAATPINAPSDTQPSPIQVTATSDTGAISSDVQDMTQPASAEIKPIATQIPLPTLAEKKPDSSRDPSNTRDSASIITLNKTQTPTEPIRSTTVEIPPTSFALVNEPDTASLRATAILPARSVPTVVINASTRDGATIPSTRASSSTLLALTGKTPIAPPQTTRINQQLDSANQTASNNTATRNSNTAWVYAGQFNNGAWVQRSLAIDNQLPNEGQSYRLATGVNLRNAPPGLRGSGRLGESIGYINQGQSVQVVQVKNSGNSGHIWLEVTR